MSVHRFGGFLSEYRRTKGRTLLKGDLEEHESGQNIYTFHTDFINFEELLYLSHRVNCHVYTLDMLTYDKLTGFNTEVLPSSFIVPTPSTVVYVFSFHVTVHRTKFLCNKTN
jgi:hypothetical protein